MGIPNLLYYAFPVFLLAMLFEYWVSKKLHLHLYFKSDFLANAGIALGDVLFGTLASLYSVIIFDYFYTEFMDWRQSTLGYRELGWSWPVWVVAILLDDFTYYWFHRSSHRVRLLWACHVVHHSSTHFNYSTAVRNGWFSVLYKPLLWVWLALLGFHPLMLISCISINAVYQFFCHSSLIKYPKWMSFFFCTPELHAVHHGKNEQYLDKNYAGMFIFYDRIFGSFSPLLPDENCEFGVIDPPKSDNIFEITFHEFRSILRDMRKRHSIWDILAILFRPPGFFKQQKK